MAIRDESLGLSETSTENDIFAPPTAEELAGPEEDIFAPPTAAELAEPAVEEDIFAPPTAEELAAPDIATEKPGGKLVFAPHMMPADMVESLAAKYGKTPEDVRSLVIMHGATADLVKGYKGKDDAESMANSYQFAQDAMQAAEREGGLAALKSPFYQAAAFVNSPDVLEVLPRLKEYGIGAVSNMTLMLPMLVAKQFTTGKDRELMEEIHDFVDKDWSVTRGALQLLVPAGVSLKAAAKVGKAALTASAVNLTKAGVSLNTATKVAPWIGRTAGMGVLSAQTGVMGAVLGGLSAKEGHAVEDALDGAMIGAAIPLLGAVGGKAIGIVGGAAIGRVQGWQTQRLLNIAGEVAKRQEAQAKGHDTLWSWFRGESALPENQAELEGLAKTLGITSGEISRIIKGKEGENFSRKMLKAPAYRIDAIQTALRTRGTELFDEFANDYLKKYTALKTSGVDMNKLFKSFKSAEDFRAGMQAYSFIPEGVRAGALRILGETGNFKKGVRVVTDWVSRIGADERDVLMQSRGSVNSYIDKVSKVTGQDPAYLKTLWNGFITNKITESVIERKGPASLSRATSFKERAVGNLLGAQYRIDDMERRYGMDELSLAHMRINNKSAQAERTTQELLGRVSEDFGTEFQETVAKYGDAWDERFFVLVHENPKAAEKVLRESVSSAEGAIVTPEIFGVMKAQSAKLSQSQAMLREELGKLGFIVDERKGYMQHQVLAPLKAILRVDGELTRMKLIEEISAPGGEKLFNSRFTKRMKDDPEFRQVVKSIERLSHQKIKDSETFRYGLSTMMDVQGTANRLSPMVSAAYERSQTDEIPILIREINPLKTIDRYLRNSFRAAFLKNELTAFQKYVPMFEKLATQSAESGSGEINRAKVDYDFLRDYLNLAMGYNAGVVDTEAARQVLARARKAASKYGVESHQVDAVFSRSHNISRSFSNLIYTSLMLNPRTVLRNMEASWTMTAVETGLPQANNWALQSYIEMALNPKAVYAAERDAMLKSGKLTERTFGESIEKVKYGGSILQRAKATPKVFKETGTWEGVAHTTGIVSEVGLSLFGWSEKIIRTNAVLTAKKWAKHIGSMETPDALADTLKGIQSPGIKKKLTQLGRDLIGARGKVAGATTLAAKAQARKSIGEIEEQMSDITSDYLLQRTQFIYTELNKAKFARDVGPLLSMFTKWPLEIGGRLANRVMGANARKGIEELMAPTIMLGLAGMYIKSRAEGDERTEAMAEFYPGKQEFYTHSPLANFAAFNLPQNPPLVTQPLVDALKATMGNESAFRRLLITGARWFMPPLPMAEAIVDDVITKLVKGRAGEAPVKEWEKEMVEDYALPLYQIIKESITDGVDALKDFIDRPTIPGFSSLNSVPRDQWVKADTSKVMGKGFVEGIKREVTGTVGPIVNLLGGDMDAPELYQGAPSMAGVPGKIIKAGKALKYGETGATAAKAWLAKLPESAKGVLAVDVKGNDIYVNGIRAAKDVAQGAKGARDAALKWVNEFEAAGKTVEKLWKD